MAGDRRPARPDLRPDPTSRTLSQRQHVPQANPFGPVQPVGTTRVAIGPASYHDISRVYILSTRIMNRCESRQDRVVGGVRPNNLFNDRGVRFEEDVHNRRHTDMGPTVPDGSRHEPAPLVDKSWELASATQGLPRDCEVDAWSRPSMFDRCLDKSFVLARSNEGHLSADSSKKQCGAHQYSRNRAHSSGPGTPHAISWRCAITV